MVIFSLSFDDESSLTSFSIESLFDEYVRAKSQLYEANCRAHAEPQLSNVSHELFGGQYLCVDSPARGTSDEDEPPGDIVVAERHVVL